LASNPDISKAISQPDIDFWEGTYLINNVKSHAFDVNRKMQTPQVQTSRAISEVWKNWKLIKE
ncbi:hypothetical protein, partial [Parabacteroides goldsteinii]|uniref:hypothetical protein n=1 Tax=Parabacteroides goldsteinii TaxID=328812 RepID=UPI0025B71CE9